MTPAQIAAVEAEVESTAASLFPSPSKANARVRAAYVDLHLSVALKQAEQRLQLADHRRKIRSLHASRRQADAKMGEFENMLVQRWGIAPVVRELPMDSRAESVAVHRAMIDHAAENSFQWFARTISDGRRKGATLRVVAVSKEAMTLAMLFHLGNRGEPSVTSA
jgi:hypothetical protein